MPTITDFLLGVSAGSTAPVANVWVRFTNNLTSATFVSNAATDSFGTFTILSIPPGVYTIATGPTAIGPFTNTTDSNYFIGADTGASSNTFLGSIFVQGSAPWYDVKAYGAKGDGTTDDTSTIASALTAAGATGGVVFMPPGNFRINSTLVVPYGVELRGCGRSATTISALGTFPTSTQLVQLGPIGSIGVGCRLRSVAVNCNNIAGSIGIYSEGINENSGIFEAMVQNYVSRAVQIKQPASGPQPQHFSISDLEIYSGSGTVASAIGVDIAMTTQITNFREIRAVTVFASLNTQLTTAIKIDGVQGGVLQSIHVENAVDGILIGSVAGCFGLSIRDVDGLSNVTNLVHISATNTSRSIAITDVTPAGSTNALVDGQFSNTITTDVGMYVIGRNTWVMASDGNVIDQVGRIKVGKDLQRSRQTPTETVLVSGVDATAGEQVDVTLTAARLVGAPLNPSIGQYLTFTLTQGGAGAFAVTWNAVFKVTWSDAGNATGKISGITFRYNGTNWTQVGAQAPYV